MSKKRYPRSENIDSIGQIGYVAYGTEQEASDALSKVVPSYSGTSFASRHSRMGFDPESVGGDGVSGRYGLTHSGYENFRPSERSQFFDIKRTMLASEMCYYKHGLIRNIFDLMADFATQGIRITHPNKRIEKFFQNWFRRVHGIERSERFVHTLSLLGNVVVRWQTAKINVETEQRLFRTSAAPDMEVKNIKVNKREIPWKYVFHHPINVEVVGGFLANFVGDPQYALRIPQRLRDVLAKKPQGQIEEFALNKLPAEVRQASESKKFFPLPKDKTRVFHYKKNDWDAWACPILGSILLDISLYEKLKLADRAALDGAISNIRIFKLGSLEHKIIPGELAAQKLASILESNTQAGTIDLIWGPDIELVESKTSVHQFLGKEKYEPTLMAIYAGLGIPPTLTGTFGGSGSGTGTTNNFISLKTLTQRLEYARDVLVQFWNEQIRMVQEAMGFRFPAKIEFDRMTLGDEAAERALLIQLADRNLISDEMVQRHFGHDTEMERVRINRENKEREQGRIPPKASAFHDPMFEESLRKVFAQTGVVTPSELGLELLPRKSGEKAMLELRQAPQGGNRKAQPNNGRPKNSKDSSPRKTKTFRPKTKAAIELWASSAQEVISDTLNSFLLKHFDKKNMRSLTASEVDIAENIKFGVLFNLEPFCEISDNVIQSALNSPVSPDVTKIYEEYCKSVSLELGRKLNIDECKRIQTLIYTECNGETDGQTSD